MKCDLSDFVRDPRQDDESCLFEDLFAVATASLKSVNQDAVGVLRNSDSEEVGIAIADGIGSHAGADIASATCIAHLTKMVSLSRLFQPVDLNVAIVEISAELRNEMVAAKARLGDFDESNCFGTTLVCALAERHELVVSYLGNGAAFHLRGDFAEARRDGAFPWSGINLLGPHSRLIKGQNILTRYLGPHLSPRLSRPTTVRVSRDAQNLGDILLICSDGLHSADQLQFGLDDRGKRWIGENELLSKLIDDLDLCLRQGLKTSEELQTLLSKHLSSLLQDKLMDDDCSVGVIVSGQVIERYTNGKSEQRNNEN